MNHNNTGDAEDGDVALASGDAAAVTENKAVNYAVIPVNDIIDTRILAKTRWMKLAANHKSGDEHKSSVLVRMIMALPSALWSGHDMKAHGMLYDGVSAFEKGEHKQAAEMLSKLAESEHDKKEDYLIRFQAAIHASEAFLMLKEYARKGEMLVVLADIMEEKEVKSAQEYHALHRLQRIYGARTLERQAGRNDMLLLRKAHKAFKSIDLDEDYKHLPASIVGLKYHALALKSLYPARERQKYEDVESALLDNTHPIARFPPLIFTLYAKNVCKLATSYAFHHRDPLDAEEKKQFEAYLVKLDYFLTIQRGAASLYALETKARVLRSLGRTDEALTTAREGLAIDPNHKFLKKMEGQLAKAQ